MESELYLLRPSSVLLLWLLLRSDHSSIQVVFDLKHIPLGIVVDHVSEVPGVIVAVLAFVKLMRGSSTKGAAHWLSCIEISF